MAVKEVTKRWALFICHASEDKDELVRPLADALREAGYAVWYDETELKIGDSLRGAIDEGLVCSQYGLVILSPHFFEKAWTKEELDGLTARQVEGKKVILPVWHKVDQELVAKYSPTLAGKYAAKSENGIDSIVQEVKKVVRPQNAIKEEAELKKSAKGKFEEALDLIRTKDKDALTTLIREKPFQDLAALFEQVLDGIALFELPSCREDLQVFYFIQASILERSQDEGLQLLKILMDWYFSTVTKRCRIQMLKVFLTLSRVFYVKRFIAESDRIDSFVNDINLSGNFDSAGLSAEILYNLQQFLSLQNISDVLDYSLSNSQVGGSGSARPYLEKLFRSKRGLPADKLKRYLD
jgi:hypothetical protein